jgi:FixJ family two-component response regulator
LSKGLLISIVDDDEAVRASIGRLMRSLGYSAKVFSSAAEFLAFPRLDDAFCLIADIHMPAMTGIELHRTLVEAGHAIPTILITAYPDDLLRARALSDGVMCYLPKPFDDEALISFVRMALERGKQP